MAQTKRVITLIPGDGIGPEVTRAVVKILEMSGFTPEIVSFSAAPAPSKNMPTCRSRCSIRSRATSAAEGR